jgi:hypothetical protein
MDYENKDEALMILELAALADEATDESDDEDLDDGSDVDTQAPTTKTGKPKKPRDPNIQDVRLPVEIDLANDAKKMGKMIRRGRVSLFLEYIREGLQRDIIAEKEILNAKGFVPTSTLLINKLAASRSPSPQVKPAVPVSTIEEEKIAE